MLICPYCNAEFVEEAKGGTAHRLVVCRTCLNPLVAEGLLDETAAPIAGWEDIRNFAQPDSMTGAILAEMPRAIESLPVLPEFSQRILTLVRDINVSLSDLSAVVSEDQTLTIKLLRLANSVTFGGLQPVTDIKAACARLGLKTISNAVQAVANGKLYITGNALFRDRMRTLWRHALATAYCASELAHILALPRSESLFVAGLVHDVGKLVILEVVSNRYKGPLAGLRDNPKLLLEVESRLAPFIGLHVTAKWKLPPEFAFTTFFHKSPASTPSKDLLPMVHTVALAELIAEVSGFGTREPAVSVSAHPSAHALGLNDIKLAALRVDIEEKLAPMLEISSAAES
ncbi:MAG: HDOD domain-containing protein [Candidatus Hydrogenedentes bacterium]|nr:HDOD domain-containing protein [Candidatus Hydrogenedentota bacterium]